MMKLAPQKINFVINTTQLNAKYDETGAASIQVEAQRIEHIENNTYAVATLVFERVAEMRCITLNFFEREYQNYEILGSRGDEVETWRKTGLHPDPKFYEVVDSALLAETNPLYDPANFLSLKHYIVAGYDSYVEIIADSYQYSLE
ncbi:hypothetical protein VA602_01065 [Pseudomonas sp. MH2]|uniref:Uncharacterized protein n=1 Tax=Pseudomonas machongensis TaxID=3110229 RepID=A0ABU5V989_9PSED|nr:hypothetical protein [Pseudomonas sp. MH2]MEA5669925.1 hypothetical protein [Pseudomonas sp. MH2]